MVVIREGNIKFHYEPPASAKVDPEAGVEI
jgi:hypothetical protein